MFPCGGPGISQLGPPSSWGREFPARLCVCLALCVTGGQPPAVLCRLSAWFQSRGAACFPLTKGPLHTGPAVGAWLVGRWLGPRRSPPGAPRRGPVTHHAALQSPEGTLCARSPVPHKAAPRRCRTATPDGPSGDRDSSGDAPESSTSAPPHRVSHLPEDTSVSLV